MGIIRLQMWHTMRERFALFVLASLAVVAILHGYPCSSVALAQTAVSQQAPVTFKGWDITPLVGIAITVITAALGLVAKKIAAWSASSTALTNTQRAQIKLAEIGFSMVGDLWTQFSREFQLRIADGKIDAEDREEFKRLVSENIEKYTSKEELAKIADALGLPLPGIIARVVEYVIDRLTKAHDPSTPEVSAKAYPVDEDPELAALREASRG